MEYYAEIIKKNRENGVYDNWTKPDLNLEDIFPYLFKD